MAKIFVTRQIPTQGIDLLKNAGHEVVVSSKDGVLTREELLAQVKGVDAILPLLTDKMDSEVMDLAGKQLKVIANYAVGYDNIDVKSATERNIIVTNTPNVLTESVAEHAIGLILSLAHRIVEADQFMRDGKYVGWEPMLFLGNDLVGKTLGLVGFGRIGAEVAKRLYDGFNMKIVYYDTRRNEDLEKQFNMQFMELNDLLKTADFVSVHVPLLPTTKHLLGAEQFKLMKKTAYLINTSRGPVIDETALVEALKNKTIRGVGLDVYEAEPKMAEGLAELPNTVLTPHTASATEETRGAMSELAAKNIIAVLGGQPAITQVVLKYLINP
ncbi:MAG: D-glycerate dehydrogenase [Candidatus Portnoybacteria bacterium CG10_big_fil_rev_8_21_14_0_10_36_7]|uniref:D-glycerate dehydrogenase n=1 Tax=Candidatus Portnoybacteria bacterium CG10_big_fil_rev_8_21_14_0_10_36_7 TaxID=1974812 RepID=A0A2M8KET6_9BACT|nr:MAG: D-glycerate dehydrogenase [Candidatus Portnoybacteria bacterium CG10_big_fil_rev_8_21_14_0_10_36_7]